MAGGSGERFWPVSTKSRPKQFLKLGSPNESLLQEAVRRTCSMFGPDSTFIATGESWADLSRSECPELDAAHTLVEPAKRNTTGCLVWAVATFIARFDDWSQISMAVLTADHKIRPDDGFQRSVKAALDTAESTGGLVTIGIKPERPETGYGYLELGEPVESAFRVSSFREKPDLDTAASYLASGHHLWNSGMFFWTLPAFLAELMRVDKPLAELTHELAGLIKAGEMERARVRFETIEPLSIDYALMERAERVYSVTAQFQWDDLGAWDALCRTYSPDENGNVTLGDSRLVDSSNSIVYNESDVQEVCLLGVEGLVVVVTKDKVLVCPADRVQEVRRLSNP